MVLPSLLSPLPFVHVPLQLLFAVLALVMAFPGPVKYKSDWRDRGLHHGGYFVKVALWMGFNILPFFFPNGLVNAYGEQCWPPASQALAREIATPCSALLERYLEPFLPCFLPFCFLLQSSALPSSALPPVVNLPSMQQREAGKAVLAAAAHCWCASSGIKMVHLPT